ncbi:MAG: Flp family type IVb pilin [Deltaproteobacteria bacterium]|nr:Flp family type IVb pilin [Deltaproteobacteria bacterium]
MEFLKRLINEEEGQGIVEYALIVALVVFVIWSAVTVAGIGEGVTNIFSEVETAIENATN